MKKNARQHNPDVPLVHSRSYILRLWCEVEPKTANWRATLEDPHTGERLGFASLEQLFTFLIEQSEKDSNLSLRSG